MSQSIQFKRGSANDIDALGKLADTVFRPHLLAGTGMPNEFRVAFNEDNAKNLYFAADDDVPISLVGIVPGQIHLDGAPIHVASMGSVCTLPDYRKQHVVSKLIEQFLADFHPTTSLLFVSGGLPIYRRVGCVDFGRRTVLTIGRSLSEQQEDDEVKVVPLFRDDTTIAQLTALYRAERFHYSRDERTFATLLGSLDTPYYHWHRVPPMVFGAIRNGQIVAYAVAGLDIKEKHVHLLEWAGERGRVAGLVRFIMDWYDSEQLRMKSQSFDDELFKALAPFEMQTFEECNQGTIRVMNPALLAKELAPYLKMHYGACFQLVEAEEGVWEVQWTLGVDGNVPETWQGVRLEGLAELGSWLFGSDGMAIPLPHTDDLNYM